MNTEEADKVAVRIAKILSEKAFSFTPNEYISIHNRSMHISGRFAEVDIKSVKADIESREVNIESTKMDIQKTKWEWHRSERCFWDIFYVMT